MGCVPVVKYPFRQTRVFPLLEHIYRDQKKAHRFLPLLILSSICIAGVAEEISAADSSGNAPGVSTPQKLQEAWLRFHETDLCQEVDAVFVFHKSGMEAWSRIESDKIQMKFLELFDPLRNLFRIELYTTRPLSKKKSGNEDDPPPSLWQNLELRANMGDPVAQFKGRLDPEERIQIDLNLPDGLIKQRLLVYAERTLDWNRKMESYATDLPALVRLALNPAADPGIALKSAKICTAHAQNLEKQIGKLISTLALAFPKSSRRTQPSAPEASIKIQGKTPVDSAEQISAGARLVAQRVHRFVHPEAYIVGLDELRNPSLLESLRELKAMVSDLQKSISKPVQSGVK